MTPFLKQVALAFYENHSDNIADFCFVFPNHRSGLFFEKYLSEIANSTFLSPEITTISSFFSRYSEYQIEDKLGLLFRLHHIFNQVSTKQEDFDSFYGFGEMILRDFEDIDKQLVNAKDLFQNLKDIQDINFLTDYLSENQIELIRRFWTEFNPTKNNEKKFIETWDLLYNLYLAFKDDLAINKYAYEGMMLRNLLENDTKFDRKNVVFVGFNALSKVEKKLFQKLKKQDNADFYWDYQSKLLKDPNNKASFFVEDNLIHFSSKYHIEEYMSEKQHITAINIPSNIGQSKQVKEILHSINQSVVGIETAVVLANEHLLLPMINSLPENAEKVNVTMGYPMAYTPIKEFIENLLLLQKNATTNKNVCSFYYKPVISILSHQYIVNNIDKKILTSITNNIHKKNLLRVSSQFLIENSISNNETNCLLLKIFSTVEINDLCGYIIDIIKELLSCSKQQTTKTNYIIMEEEFLYQCYTTLQRINNLLQQWNITPSKDTLGRLIKNVINTIAIPFEGHPLSGLQIMGMLETRCLDFKNLIITSFNEGNFPKNDTAPSFIPYNLRLGFDLPTTEHQDAIYAYHFYRLIQRAQNIYLLYDNRNDKLNAGEKSRYINQLQYGYNVPFEQTSLSFTSNIVSNKAISIQKTKNIIDKLSSYYTHSNDILPKKFLSPSAINDYIDCPLRFYFKHIEKIKEQETISDFIKHNDFGTIIHYVMEELYKGKENSVIQSSYFKHLISEKGIVNNLVKKGFAKHFFKINENEELPELEGNLYIISEVIKAYIFRFLEHEETRNEFTFISHEEKCEDLIFLNYLNAFVGLQGKIDRVDLCNGEFYVIDYKTGKPKNDFKTERFEDLFDNKKSSNDILQLMWYSWLYEQKLRRMNKQNNIKGKIYYFKNIFSETEELSKEIDFNESIQIKFVELLTQCLEDIFNPNIPFQQTTNTKLCNEYCSYNNICKKDKTETEQ